MVTVQKLMTVSNQRQTMAPSVQHYLRQYSKSGLPQLQHDNRVYGSVWSLLRSTFTLIFLRRGGHLCSLYCLLKRDLSPLPPISNPILWQGSRICFDNTAERFDCASLPRCWWIGKSNNGPSTEWSIKDTTDDLMMIEGPCMRVGPPASESCFHHHTGSHSLWFEAFR